MKHASVDKAKRVSSQCRNHGQCPYCRRSRTMQTRRVEAAGGAAMRELVNRDRNATFETYHCRDGGSEIRDAVNFTQLAHRALYEAGMLRG